MKKIMHVVGNRPQFIKLAPLSRELRSKGYEEVIVHTGQHYDENMSDVFFEELDIPKPDENLHVSGGTHAQMTGDMIKALEGVIQKHNPDLVVVYGDTNSTLAAAITARKLGVKVAHVEAGVRTRVDDNPEEINRKAVDHIVDFLFAPDKQALENLKQEGLSDISFFSGDVMYDAYKYYSQKSFLSDNLKNIPDEFVLLTWHHQENTDNKDRMSEVLDFIEKIPDEIVCPLHPRTRKMLDKFGLWNRAEGIKKLHFTDPVGYLEIIELQNRSKWIATDSGGLSKEAYYAKKKCIYLFDFTVWPDLEKDGWIIHIEGNADKAIEEASGDVSGLSSDKQYYGNGDAAKTIVSVLETKM